MNIYSLKIESYCWIYTKVIYLLFDPSFIVLGILDLENNYG